MLADAGTNLPRSLCIDPLTAIHAILSGSLPYVPLLPRQFAPPTACRSLGASRSCQARLMQVLLTGWPSQPDEPLYLANTEINHRNITLTLTQERFVEGNITRLGLNAQAITLSRDSLSAISEKPSTELQVAPGSRVAAGSWSCSGFSTRSRSRWSRSSRLPGQHASKAKAEAKAAEARAWRSHLSRGIGFHLFPSQIFTRLEAPSLPQKNLTRHCNCFAFRL